jgi:hypothetical protein
MTLGRRSFCNILVLGILLACQPIEHSKEPNGTPIVHQTEDEGGRVGNGGGIILCADHNEVTKLELFDFYEAAVDSRRWLVHTSNYQPDPSKSNLDQALDLARYIIDSRWKPIDPVMAEYLTKKLREFPLKTAWLTMPLRRLSDLENFVSPPTGCKYVQLAIQNTPVFPWDKRYTIQKDLFEHPLFPASHRAGLILHELIYGLTIVGGALDSRGTRNLNAMLFANRQSEFFDSHKRYLDHMKNIQMPWAGTNNIAIRLDAEYRFHPGDDVLALGSAIPGSWAETPIGRQQIKCDVAFNELGQVTGFNIGNPEGKIDGIRLGEFEPFTLFDSQSFNSSMRRDLGWEAPYESAECKNDGRFDFLSVDLAGSTSLGLKKIQPCLKTNLLNSFYHVQGCVDQNIEISQIGQNSLVTGSTSFLASRLKVTFNSGESCNASTVGTSQVTLDWCTAEVAPSRVARMMGEVHVSSDQSDISITLMTGDAQEFPHKFTYQSSVSPSSTVIVAKPGTLMTLERTGAIRWIVLAKDTKLCNLKSGKMEIFPSGARLSFSDNGCVDGYFGPGMYD